MANPATIDDVEARWRSLTTAEAVTAQVLLDYAWAVIVSTVTDVEDRIDDETLDAKIVTFVIVTAVMRVMKNPDGLRQHTVSLDDGSETRTWNNSTVTDALYFTPEELAQLATTSERAGAFTIRPYGEAPSRSTEPQLWF